MRNKPLITIIIPTYNRKDLLKKSLESAINQTYTNLEILISDNHSEDGTEELCNEYLKTDNRIKYFRHSENIGATNNCNFIQKKVTGEYLVTLCDDDWLDLDYVEKCVKFIEKHDGYTIVVPTTIVYDSNYRRVKLCPCKKIDYKNKEYRFKRYVELMKSGNFLVTGLFKVSIAKEIIDLEGNLFTDRFAEDWVLMLKYSAVGKIKMLGTTHYNKVNNGYSTTWDGLKELWNFSKEKSFSELLLESLCNSIKSDLFFKKYLTKDEINEIPQIIENVLKETNKPTNYRQLFCKVMKWIIFHPLFMFKKEIYINAFKTFKTLLIIHI